MQPGPDATGPAAARVVLVAPPSDGFLEQTPEIAGFIAGGTDADDDARAGVAAALAAASLEAPIVVQSDADPCSPAGTTSFADAFELDRVIVPGGGHLTIEDGFGPLPLVLDLVLEVEATTAAWETRAR
ncbi:alpha/beta hydrolase [Agromyces endophyticus]|uniref:alpha/beta hydrolase n=1 Tax=Agromyces sp. H17E-10 TaxID=2932244 RepID=UPI002101DEFC|nr:alpha/beta hydrolase [Agromyces sp. H17E-10]